MFGNIHSCHVLVPKFSGDPSLPAFSMEGLGASRSVKIVVYTALAVIRTIETAVWCRWGWAKMYPQPEKVEGGSEGAVR